MSDLHAVLESTKHERGWRRLAVAKANFDFQQSLEIVENLKEQVLFRGPKARRLEHLPACDLEVNDGALEERRLDESIELGEKEVDRFIAFRSDRSFRVEIDERRFEWGDPELTGLIAKQIVGADPACVGIWLERRSSRDLFLADTDVVKLATEGVEKLHTGPVFLLRIEGKEFQWPEPVINPAQIAKLGGWDPSQGVQQIDLATNEARTLKPDEVVDLKELKTFAKKIGWQRG